MRIWAANALGTTIALPAVHSTASGFLPGRRISMRAMPSGSKIGGPLEMKSSQWELTAAFDLDEELSFGDDIANDQQKPVLPSSEALAGIDNSETKDLAPPGTAVEAEGAFTNETR